MPISSSSESDCEELDSPLGSKSRKRRKELRELETMKDLMRQLKEQKEETNRILMALGNLSGKSVRYWQVWCNIIVFLMAQYRARDPNRAVCK
jgi:hypothetical protein